MGFCVIAKGTVTDSPPPPRPRIWAVIHQYDSVLPYLLSLDSCEATALGTVGHIILEGLNV